MARQKVQPVVSCDLVLMDWLPGRRECTVGSCFCPPAAGILWLGGWHALLYFSGSCLVQTVCSVGRVFPAMDRVQIHPSSGAEQTEKADAPREPPPAELKPDPTSSMAAAEAEALSESSEQGALPTARAGLATHTTLPSWTPLPASLFCLDSIHLSFSSFLTPELSWVHIPSMFPLV